MGSLIRYGFFPTVFFGGLFAAAVALHRGVSEVLAVGVATLVAAMLFAGAEKVAPFYPSWRMARGDWPADLAHTFVSTLVPPEILKATLFAALTGVSVAASEHLGIQLWPELPLPVGLLLAVVVAEFGSYWAHRAMHEVPALWRLHAVHHSAERLYWLNAGRSHPLDIALQYTGQALPLVLLGTPAEIIALFSLWTSMHGLGQHANIDLRLGPLNWFFSMAELHRWHHSRVLDEANNNYGANSCVWDIVFGTRFLPADRKPPENVGISDSERFPTGFFDHLAVPFAWERLVEEGTTPKDTPEEPA